MQELYNYLLYYQRLFIINWNWLVAEDFFFLNIPLGKETMNHYKKIKKHLSKHKTVNIKIEIIILQKNVPNPC